ncbi:uncharacterized protein LOC134443296 [Engraulis encrasicolus]|uniref:uncharacterized protein LOC134443296 n=1 Tax=Engraulis encrasicolus TaxID=184585 RepID=UPI002FD65C6C
MAFAARLPLPFSSTPVKTPRQQELEEEDEPALEGSSSPAAPEDLDSTYDPLKSVLDVTASSDISELASTPIPKVNKFIVYETCIMELFEVCPDCKHPCTIQTRRLGTFISVAQQCNNCEYQRTWNSQPLLKSTPAGNIQLSAAIYLSGASYFKIKRVFRALHLQMFEYDTFRRHARSYIEPAIVTKWKETQDAMMLRLREGRAIVGGDMRADSPGHSAKFGSYSLMDLNTNTVIDVQLVQSNEVGGSYHMELAGLKRSLELLEKQNVTLDCIVTDRHPQIQKFLRESGITQYYDVWHVVKGISKKLDSISKKKGCQSLKKWIPAVRNHTYWTAATSTTGPERRAKWTSLLNHVCDVHTHDDPLFPACLHAVRDTTDKSKWLRAGTQAFYELDKMASKTRLLNDIAKLSPHHQTSALESFHSVILQFAPKSVVFPFLGMLCRLYLAAFHYNENAERDQATASSGEPLYRMHYPKALKGEARVKPIKTDPTFGYVEDLISLIMGPVFDNSEPYREAITKINIPPDLSADYDHPEKKAVIANYVSLFNPGQAQAEAQVQAPVQAEEESGRPPDDRDAAARTPPAIPLI